MGLLHQGGQHRYSVAMGAKFVRGVNDLSTTAHFLLGEWHPTKNLPLTPTDVMPGTSKKIWWQCALGHEFEAKGNNRVNGTGCPYCANKKVLPGFNDLATSAPELLVDWDYDLNKLWTPEAITRSSGKQIWWRCRKGHSWTATPDARTGRKTGCPVCQNLKLLLGYNDLASTHPELAAEIDVEKNNGLGPEGIIAGAAKKVWWKCPEGHSYQSTVDSRCHGSGCGYCSNRKVLDGWNDLATISPELLPDWHPTANLPLLPQEVQAGSAKKVWWRCEKGHEYRSVVFQRQKGVGCMNCAKTGYDSTKGGILYFIEHSRLHARKIGITNADIRTKRIKLFVHHGWTVIRIFEFASGSQAQQLEKQMFQWLREELAMPTHLAREDLGKLKGHTETFSSDGISNSEIVNKVLQLMEG